MATPSRPNIIFILADDMGYGDVGCYGATQIPTPNMDAIAARGVRCTDAHSSSAVCTPSRYSVLTGRYCWRTRLKNMVLGGFGAPLIEDGRLTVATMLREQGYATAAFGKWHLGLDWRLKDGQPYASTAGDWTGWRDREGNGMPGFEVDYTHALAGGPCDNGFDHWYGISGSLDMPPYCYIEDRQVVGTPDREKPHYFNQQRKGLTVDGWRDDEVDTTFTRHACDWIEERTRVAPEQPFFAYIPTASPHRPCDIRPAFVTGASQAGDRGDMVVLFDWIVGQVTATLDRLGIADDTLVIVTSDNGARISCANGETYGHRTNGALRGQKADIYDGGHREPFLVQWPRRLPQGAVCDELICLSDFMATAAAVVGFDLPDGAAEDSFNILPALNGSTFGEPIREGVIHHALNGLFSIRVGDWKLVEGLGSGGFTDPQRETPTPDGPTGQLYNLVTDPAETTNLWLAEPEKVALLSTTLNRWRDAGRTRSVARSR